MQTISIISSIKIKDDQIIELIACLSSDMNARVSETAPKPTSATKSFLQKKYQKSCDDVRLNFTTTTLF